MKTIVVNCRVDDFDVYVGRDKHHPNHHFGNPYSHRPSVLHTVRVDTVDKAVLWFGEWVRGERDRDLEPDRRFWILENLERLRGKRLGCFGCNPCHASVLKYLADIRWTRTVGFTGTRKGMTPAQKETVRKALRDSFKDGARFRHGDCLGADAESHRMAIRVGYRVYVHPPINERNRAFCEGGIILKAKDYHVRDRDIVDRSFVLVATPKKDEEELRSGTWTTIRYARKLKRKIFIVWPDGDWTWENAK